MIERLARSMLWATLPDSDPINHRGQGYIPTSDQLQVLDDDHGQILVAGGDRGGKSSVAGMKAFLGVLEFIGSYGQKAMGETAWIVAENYELTRPEYEYTKTWLRRSPLGGKAGMWASTPVNPGLIKIYSPKTGNRDEWFSIKTKSTADAVESLVAESPVFVLVCEAAKTSIEVYRRLRSRVSESRARFPGFGWIMMGGSFEGSLGWYPLMWEQWRAEAVQRKLNARSFSLPAAGNNFVFGPGVDPQTNKEHDGGLNHPELVQLKAELPENIFSERVLAVPMPPAGRVHHLFQPQTHIYDFEYRDDLPVYIAIDPGFSGATSHYHIALLQKVDGQWRNFDEIAHTKVIEEEIIESFVKKAYWWKNPNKVAVIDTAGGAHAGAHASNIEVWRKLTGLHLYHQKVPVMSGIERMDSFLKINADTSEPGIVFHSRCEWIISELGGGPHPIDGQTHIYQWKADQYGNVVGKVPNDRYNDGVKAITYLLIHEEGYARSETRRTIRVRGRKDRHRVGV